MIVRESRSQWEKSEETLADPRFDAHEWQTSELHALPREQTAL